jgi:hypothetical protein
VKIRTLENVNATLLNAVLFLIGALMVTAAALLGATTTLGVVLISVGTSVIASAGVAFLNSRYLARGLVIQEMIDQWGIIGIFHTRSTMNTRADITLSDLNGELDLMGYGFSAFRHARGDMIEKKVRDGLRMRVLTVDPHSQCVVEREHAEGSVPGQIARTILDLEEWVKKLQRISPRPDNVQIKFCEAPIIQSYYRQDDYVYTGPYLHGKPSQQTISFEYRKGGLGYEYWAEHFESLWHSNFASENHRPLP